MGTGFSQGTPSARSETDVASQFLGFLEQWITTFGFQNKKIYVTGESYAGQYVPFIVDGTTAAPLPLLYTLTLEQPCKRRTTPSSLMCAAC